MPYKFLYRGCRLVGGLERMLLAVGFTAFMYRQFQGGLSLSLPQLVMAIAGWAHTTGKIQHVVRMIYRLKSVQLRGPMSS